MLFPGGAPLDLRDFVPWLALVGFGAYHGINPAMGWLFAVTLGLQEENRRAVYAAFLPIALGHTASVVLVVVALVVAGVIVPLTPLKIIGAVILIGLGVFKLLRPLSHPRWVRMRVGFRSLTAWSFLMSSAHGAGLMLVPILFTLPLLGVSPDGVDLGELEHVEYMGIGGAPSPAMLVSQVTAVAIHTVAMFSVMAATAILVFEKVGLAILRRAWFNVDKLWAISLVVSGAVTLML